MRKTKQQTTSNSRWDCKPRLKK